MLLAGTTPAVGAQRESDALPKGVAGRMLVHERAHPSEDSVTQHLMVYLGLVLLPTAAFYGARRGLEHLVGGTWTGRVSAGPVAQAIPSPDGLAARLRRLSSDYDRLKASSPPAQAARMRAVALAYDDTLRDCCAATGLPDPGSPPLTAASRLSVEAALSQRGVTW